MSNDIVVPLTAAGITQALRDSKYIVLPPGTIDLDSSISITGPCTLVGSGYGTRLHASGDFPIITMVDGDTQPEGVVIENLRLTRQNTQAGIGTATASEGVRVWGTFVTIRDLWIEDCTTGILFREDEAPSRAVRLENINITNLDINLSFAGFNLRNATTVTMVGCAQVPGRNYTHLTIDDAETLSDVQGDLAWFELAPEAATADAIYSGLAGNDTENAFTPTGQPDVPRSLTITFAADWDGGDITIHGTDQFEFPISHTEPSDPGSVTETSAVFKVVTLITKSAVGADPAEVDIGYGNSHIGIEQQVTTTDPEDCQLLVDGTATPVTAVFRSSSSFRSGSAPDGSKVYRVQVPVLRR